MDVSARTNWHFPGETWERTTPDAAGYNPEQLQAFAERVGGHGCIVHRGRMLADWGEMAQPHDLASAAKPIYAHFVLMSLQAGRIGSLDDPLLRWVPELAGLNPDLDFKDRHITWRHLLRQTSGYGVTEPPGAAFAYNDYQTGLLIWTLVRRVYACGYAGADATLMRGELFDRIGCEDSPSMQTSTRRPARVTMSARDLARFGWLYLGLGQWDRGRVLAADLVREAIGNPTPPNFPRTAGQATERIPGVPTIGGHVHRASHLGAISHFWWVNTPNASGDRLFPSGPSDLFAAIGYSGQYALVVLPGHELVLAWMKSFGDLGRNDEFDRRGRSAIDEALRILLARTAEPGGQVPAEP
jgi:CubicO group peptidase (beta-lactamase class C family)